MANILKGIDKIITSAPASKEIDLNNIQAAGGGTTVMDITINLPNLLSFDENLTINSSASSKLSGGVGFTKGEWSLDGSAFTQFTAANTPTTGSFVLNESASVAKTSAPTGYTEAKVLSVRFTDTLGNVNTKTVTLVFGYRYMPSIGPNTTNTTYSNYNVYTFTSSDYFHLYENTVLDVLIVGGGACGDKGGGGAGGVREWTSMLFPAGEYSIDIGGGGSPSSMSGNPTEITLDTPTAGGSFTTITASGGGMGAGWHANSSYVAGESGGSGGGALARGFSASNYNVKGVGNAGGNTSAVNGGTPVNTVEGYDGGNAATSDHLGCGGGGGAAGAGGNGSTGSVTGASGEGGNGGLAYSTSIRNGVTEWFAGGGGGSGKNSSGGVHISLGGGTSTALQKGGGTDGSYELNHKAADSAANTGGGSGGCGWGTLANLIGAGGSGIVILRTSQY